MPDFHEPDQAIQVDVSYIQIVDSCCEIKVTVLKTSGIVTAIKALNIVCLNDLGDECGRYDCQSLVLKEAFVGQFIAQLNQGSKSCGPYIDLLCEFSKGIAEYNRPPFVVDQPVAPNVRQIGGLSVTIAEGLRSLSDLQIIDFACRQYTISFGGTFTFVAMQKDAVAEQIQVIQWRGNEPVAHVIPNKTRENRTFNDLCKEIERILSNRKELIDLINAVSRQSKTNISPEITSANLPSRAVGAWNETRVDVRDHRSRTLAIGFWVQSENRQVKPVTFEVKHSSDLRPADVKHALENKEGFLAPVTGPEALEAKHFSLCNVSVNESEVPKSAAIKNGEHGWSPGIGNALKECPGLHKAMLRELLAGFIPYSTYVAITKELLVVFVHPCGVLGNIFRLNKLGEVTRGNFGPSVINSGELFLQNPDPADPAGILKVTNTSASVDWEPKPFLNNREPHHLRAPITAMTDALIEANRKSDLDSFFVPLSTISEEEAAVTKVSFKARGANGKQFIITIDFLTEKVIQITSSHGISFFRGRGHLPRALSFAEGLETQQAIRLFKSLVENNGHLKSSAIACGLLNGWFPKRI